MKNYGRGKNNNKWNKVQPVLPFELMVFNGKELDIQVKQWPISKRDENKLVKLDVGLIDQGKDHLDRNQEQPCSQYPVGHLGITLGGDHQSREKCLGKSYI